MPEVVLGESVKGPAFNLVSRVNTKPNEHPGTPRSNLPRKWADKQPLSIRSMPGNDN